MGKDKIWWQKLSHPPNVARKSLTNTQSFILPGSQTHHAVGVDAVGVTYCHCAGFYLQALKNSINLVSVYI